MPYSVRILRELDELDPKLKGVFLANLEEIEKNVKETVKKSDFEELNQIVAKLGESVAELAQAQKKTEEKVTSLAEALEKLTKSHYELRQEVGFLSHTVGYRLEDESFKALPQLLKRDLGIEVRGRIKRDFIEIGPNRYLEVNIFGYGESNGKEYVIIGEAKSQLKKGDVDSFLKKTESIKKYIPNDQIKVLVTYIASPQVQRYVRGNNIQLYFSYDF